MKKIITLALGVVAMLTSCSKEDIGSSVNPNTDQVTITLAAEDAVATRAASEAPTRYIVEAYSDATYTTAANMFGDADSETNQTTITPTSGTATLNLTIDRTKDYYFLFWSDVSGSDVYTTTSLTAVTLNSGKTPVESWQGTAQILKGTSQPTLSVTLSRAVAKINLMETGALPAGSSLAMTFAQNTVFDVSSGSVSTTATRTETIENSSAIDGSTTAVQLNSSEIYLFAAVESQTIHEITFKMNDEDSFNITNVPFQANHATNITGHYTKLSSETFTLSVDDTWATPDNDVDVEVDIPLSVIPVITTTSDNVVLGYSDTTSDGNDNGSTVKVEWSLSSAEGLEKIHVYYVKSGETFNPYTSDFQYLTSIETDSPSFTLTGLDGATTYTIYVASTDSEDTAYVSTNSLVVTTYGADTYTWDGDDANLPTLSVGAVDADNKVTLTWDVSKVPADAVYSIGYTDHNGGLVSGVLTAQVTYSSTYTSVPWYVNIKPSSTCVGNVKKSTTTTITAPAP